LEYNPNSALVINTLSDFYTSYIPDTEKYLEYAIKGISLDIAAQDSITASFVYLALSNALVQSGFVNEAEKYINTSLEYYPDNLYSEYVKAYILFAKNGDLFDLKELLINALNKDSTRLDIMQEVGKICYFLRDYESAYMYYRKFIDSKEAQNLDIYRGENAKIGFVFSKMGLAEESEKLFMDFKNYADNDKSVYKDLSLAAYYSYRGEIENAIEHLELFSQETNYHYWIILFIKMDPLVDNIKDHPEFNRILKVMEFNFWSNYKKIKTSLRKKELL